MNAQQGASDQTKSRRDKRAWNLTVAFCLTIAALTVGGFALNASFEYVDVSLVMLATSAALSLFVCPAILAWVARRRWLLWAYIPWLAFVVSLWAGSSITPMQPDLAPLSGTYTVTVTSTVTSTTTVWNAIWVIAAIVLSPLATASPVCLYRVLRRRARATELKRQAAIDEAILSRREGSWPPPPASQGTEQ